MLSGTQLCLWFFRIPPLPSLFNTLWNTILCETSINLFYNKYLYLCFALQSSKTSVFRFKPFYWSKVLILQDIFNLHIKPFFVLPCRWEIYLQSNHLYWCHDYKSFRIILNLRQITWDMINRKLLTGLWLFRQ